MNESYFELKTFAVTLCMLQILGHDSVKKLTYIHEEFNPFMTSEKYMSHLHKESFQVRWDNSIPLFLHAAIYLEVSLFR
jgi:hypothetical protein